MNETPRPSQGSILLGFLLAVALHLAAVGACCGFAQLESGDAMAGLMPFFFVGVVQLIYLGPALAIFAVAKRPRTVLGIALVLGITFLLNAACFGVFMVMGIG